ncbi:MAG: histidine phosphatase family protein [Peptococcaceae bacterium]|nr:histidine phosphatase family protein [Peptococcaceae bacterium]
MEHKVYLLRHAETEGNLSGKYIGITDEPLSDHGIQKLRTLVQTGRYPEVQHVFVSPMLRCSQTMGMIYPEIPNTIVPEFAECNFGFFENKTYEELKDTAEYQSWVDGGGKGVIPDGEDVLSFKARCCSGFERVMNKILEWNIATSALIIHGGTIMAVLEEYSREKLDFFYWKVKNCEGYELMMDPCLWAERKKIKEIIKL